MKGEILSAVGRDADNRLYPIAWAIVRVEDNESWAWFVGKLKEDLDLGVGAGFTVMSDKQKGLINAVADLLPESIDIVLDTFMPTGRKSMVITAMKATFGQ